MPFFLGYDLFGMPCSSSIVFFQSPPLLIIIIENSSNYLHVSAVNQNPTIFSSFVHPLRPLSSFRAASASACPLSFSQFALGSANLVRGGAERASDDATPSALFPHLISFFPEREADAEEALSEGKQMMTGSHDELATLPPPARLPLVRYV